MDSGSTDRDMRHQFQKTPGLLGLGVCLVVFAILFGQAVSFTSLVGYLGNWQFAKFDRYFPALTILLPVIVGLILWMLILALLQYRRKRQAIEAYPPRFMLGDAARLLLIVALCFGIGALAVFGHYLQLPDDNIARRSVSLTAALPADLREGPAIFSSVKAVGPVARYVENILVSRHTSHFIPVAFGSGGNAGDQRRPFALFVEVDSYTGADVGGDQNSQAKALPSTVSGHLRSSALPPEIVSMYRDAGFPTSSESAVLFRSVQSANNGVVVLMGEFLTFGIIAFIFALILRRADRRYAQKPGK